MYTHPKFISEGHVSKHDKGENEETVGRVKSEDVSTARHHKKRRQEGWTGSKSQETNVAYQSRVPEQGSLFSHTHTLHTLQTAIMIRRVSRDGWMDPLGRDVKKENETWTMWPVS